MCPTHGAGPVLPVGEPTILVGGKAAARVDDHCRCEPGMLEDVLVILLLASVIPVDIEPDRIVKGAMPVRLGKRPAARESDLTSHGGSITTGCAAAGARGWPPRVRRGSPWQCLAS